MVNYRSSLTAGGGNACPTRAVETVGFQAGIEAKSLAGERSLKLFDIPHGIKKNHLIVWAKRT